MKTDLSKLATGIKSVKGFFKIVEAMVKVNKKALAKEGIEVKVTRVKMEGKVWKAILIREFGK